MLVVGQASWRMVMKFDLMVGGNTWRKTADLAKQVEQAGFSGMLFTESGQVPWMMIAAAAMAAPTLEFSTGIAVAFPRSPMMSAQIAWELAQNTGGRFRLGLGSQVRGHIERRYGAVWDKPAPQMRDYVAAFKACIRAFRREEKLQHAGPYYNLSLLPAQWSPPRHDFEDIRIDISAVGPIMCRVAGELCDGVHVHPMHSMTYIHDRLLPEIDKGARRAGRSAADLDLIIPVFAVPGDTPEERAPLVMRARTQIAFYGSTPNYAFQFDDLGFPGTTPKLGALMKAGDMQGMAATITDEMLEHFALIARWDDMADALIGRYRGVASRVVSYLANEDILRHPGNLGRWGEIARAVAAA
jgi:probable F420-dependent oxidoreductase